MHVTPAEEVVLLSLDDESGSTREWSSTGRGAAAPVDPPASGAPADGGGTGAGRGAGRPVRPPPGGW